MNGIATLCQVYGLENITYVGWFHSGKKLADAVTKPWHRHSARAISGNCVSLSGCGTMDGAVKEGKH